MAGFVFVVLFAIVFVLVKAANQGSTFDGLVRNGIPARGILLEVASNGTKVEGSTRQRRFERRGVRIDVEIPGQPAYEVRANPIIPSNLVRDVLPGATVELRVHRKNPSTIAIVGPGVGFVGFSALGPGASS